MNSSPLRRQVRAWQVFTVLVLDGDRLVVEADDARVGESDAKDVAGEIVEHGLFATPPGGDVEDPGPVPHRVGDDEIRALSAQQRAELATHRLGKSLDGHQELPPDARWWRPRRCRRR